MLFEDAAAEGRVGGATIGACIALSERSLLAIADGDWALARRHLAEARSVAREANVEDYPPMTILHAVAARMALHDADQPRARDELTRAQRLRPDLTYSLPHLAVQARIELARCHLALLDSAAARTLLREVDEILIRRPGLGVFVQQAEDLRAELSRARGSSALGASALTAAELRLLPMLSTHLRFPEIAGEMFLSRHTIRSQANSLYRKLGASSRTRRSPWPASWVSWTADHPSFMQTRRWSSSRHEVKWCGGRRTECRPDSKVPGDSAQAGDDRRRLRRRRGPARAWPGQQIDPGS